MSMTMIRVLKNKSMSMHTSSSSIRIPCQLFIVFTATAFFK